MGERGPKPIPTNIRLLHGETRPSQINYDEPKPGQGEIVPPEDLTDEALEVWHRLAPDLIRVGVLAPWDVEAYAEYCNAVVSSHEAQRALDEEGEVIDYPTFDRQGRQSGTKPAVNPWWKIKREASAAVLAGAARFGLTPADRTRIKVDNAAKPKAQDNSDLLSG